MFDSYENHHDCGTGDFGDTVAEKVIDHTEGYNAIYRADALCVQTKGRRMLVFYKLERPRDLPTTDARGPRRRIRCDYAIEESYLSRDAREGTDDFACVLYGPDIEYLTAAQARPFLRASKDGSSMFNHVGFG